MDARAFATGGEFLEDLETFRPDCLVVDLHMPFMSGFEILERLHGHLPAVVITGQDSPEAEMRSSGAGAAAYLRKPVNDHALIDAIHLAIDSALPSGF